MSHCVALSRTDLSFWCYNCQSYIISPQLQILAKKASEFKHGTTSASASEKLDIIAEVEEEVDDDDDNDDNEVMCCVIKV
jgi:hypothetical protein